jgi:hypothetical protein
MAAALYVSHHTFRAEPCSRLEGVGSPANRLNVTLDPEHAARLARLAERTHVKQGTLARSLLASAIENADPEARNISALLDGIPGAFERAHLALKGARGGEAIALDDL